MIYILGKNTVYNYDDLDEVIYLVSTDINDILDYLFNKVKFENFDDYTILVKEPGNLAPGFISTKQYSWAHFIEYTPYMFLLEENKEEFEYVKEKLCVWCNKVKEEKRRLEEERERIKKEQEEAKERKLYEKLKAKYGD